MPVARENPPRKKVRKRAGPPTPKPKGDVKSAQDLGRAKTYVSERKDVKSQADLDRGPRYVQRKYGKQVSVTAKGKVTPLKTTVPPDVQARASKKALREGRIKLNYARSPVQERLVAPGLRLLKESTRSLHASAETANELLKGKRVDEALEKGGKAFLKNKGVTYSDVLKTAGVENKAVRAGLGFALDMVLDPSTGAKISRLAPKIAAERKSRQLEAGAAKAETKRTVKGVTVKPARPKKAQRLRRKSEKAAKRAETAATGKGVQVGYSAKVPFGPRVELMTSGKTTAKVGKKIAPAVERARTAAPVRAVSAAFNPVGRKPGVTPAEHEVLTYAQRKRRARLAAAERKGVRRGEAHARAAAKVDAPAMVAAVERAMVKPVAVKTVRRITPQHKALQAAEQKLATVKSVARHEVSKASQPQKPSVRATFVPKVQAAKKELEAARKAAAGVPVQRLVQVEAKTKRPYADVRAEAIQAGKVRTVEALPPKAQKVARATQAELADLKTRQQAADVLKGERADYYPHQVPKLTKAEKAKQVLVRKGGRPAKPGHAKRRLDVRPIAEQEATGKKVFSTKHGTVMGQYVAKAEKAIADADYLKEIKRVGKPLTAQTWAKRRDTDDLYAVTPTGISKLTTKAGKPLADDDVKKLIDAGEDVTILPRAVGDREVAGRQGLSTLEKGTKEAVRLANKPVQWFKTAATVLNIPFYQERNFYDDGFRAWMADTPGTKIVQAANLVKKQALFERAERTKLTPTSPTGTVRVAGKEVPAARFLKEAEEDGALRTGFFAGEDLPEEKLIPKTGIKRYGRPVQKLRQYSQNFEDVPKMATYWAARDRGFTRAEAAAHVRLYHFDYDELTDIEKGLRLFIPFYTYARKNTALQAQLIVSRPGKASAVQKAREESAKAFGQDPNLDESLNEPDQRAMPLIGPNGQLYYNPLGITDLNRIPFATTWNQVKDLPGQQFDLAMQMLGPHIKLPVELGQNYSFFFRDAIFRSKDEPDARRWVPAPGWAKTAGFDTELIEVDGKKVAHWSAKTDYIIRSLGPQLGLLSNVQNPVRNSRGQSMNDMIFKQATGIRRASIDDRLMAGMTERTVKRLGEVDAKINDLGDLGKKAEGKFFYSKQYEGLLDERKQLIELLRTLKEKKSGVPVKKPIRLSRRPISEREKMRREFEEFRKRDPQAERQKLRDEFEKFRERQRLTPSG